VLKNISRRHKTLTGFNVENAENVSMNPVQYIGCYVIYAEGVKRKEQ
jgi:hypothetical protein